MSRIPRSLNANLDVYRFNGLIKTYFMQYNTSTFPVGKSTAEIRLEVLQAALGHVDGLWYAQLDRARHLAGEGKAYELPEDKRIREALKLAKKLYAFVEPATTADPIDDSE